MSLYTRSNQESANYSPYIDSVEIFDRKFVANKISSHIIKKKQLTYAWHQGGNSL